MHQIKIDRSKVISDGSTYADFSFENDLFVVYRVDIEAFCIYRGGIFHRNVSLLGRPKSIVVRDGLINVLFQTGSDFKTIVYTSDGSYSHEYCIKQLDSPYYLCDYRVCEFTQNHDGGVRQITDTSQLMSVTWIRKNDIICQCYNSQSILLSSFKRENCRNVWMERNATFVCWEGDALRTYDRFGVLISSVHTDLTPLSGPYANFSMIGGECYKFEFSGRHLDQQNALIISNRHGSWRHQVNPFLMSLSLTTGNCAKMTDNGDVVTFDCFY